MSVRSAQSITADFTTCRFDTGAATVADSLPTGTLVINGTDDAATVTITSKSGGKYKAAVTLPTLAIGDVVQIRIAATVNSVAGIGVIWTDTKDFAIDSNGKGAATIAAGDIATDAITAASVKADAVTKIQNGLSTLAAGAAMTLTSAYDAAKTAATQTSLDALVTTVGVAGAGLTAADDATLAAIAALNNVSAAQVNTQCASAITSAALATASNLAIVAGYLDTEIAAIKASTDNLPSDPADASVIAALIAAIPAAPSAAAVSAQVAADLATAHGSGSWATATGFAVAGNAMTLTTGERTAIANEVESQIIDETDSEKVLSAITDKIAAVNPSMAGLTAGVIASATRTELATELARIDAAISSRSTYAGADTSGTTTLLARVPAAAMLASSYTTPPTVAQVRAEMDASSTKLASIVADTDELQTDWHNGGRLDLILDSAAASGGGDVTVGEFSDAALDQLADVATITIETPIVNGEDITLRRGDDYLTEDGRQLRFTNSAGTWPDLTDATFALQFRRSNQTVTCETSNVITATGENQRVDIDALAAETALLNGSPWIWSLVATLDSGSIVTLASGKAQVS